MFNCLSKNILRKSNFLYTLRVVYVFAISLLLSGCQAVTAPFSAVSKSQFDRYESEHVASFSECGEITVGVDKYTLRCSSREVSDATMDRMKEIYRYYLKWGYSNAYIHMPSAGYSKDIITTRFDEIHNIKVSHRSHTWNSPYGELDYFNDVKDIGRKQAVNRCGLIISIDTQGDNYQGLRFFFYNNRCTYGYSIYTPTIVFSSETGWDKPEWDIEVRAYSSKNSSNIESGVNEQIYAAIVNQLLNKYYDVLTQ